MLPLRDDIPSRRYPVVTLIIVAINVVVFLWELSLGRRLHEVILMLALVPVRYTVGEVADLFSLPEQVTPFLRSMFLHGGWTHLLGNNVDALGIRRQCREPA